MTGGTGSINLVAGWDGVTNDPGAGSISGGGPITASGFAVGQFGINNGTVRIGSDTQRVAVASLKGATDVAAGSLVIQGSDNLEDAGAQLGFFRYDVNAFGADPTDKLDTPGDIIVRIDGGSVSLDGGDMDGSFAQLGHGGLNAGDNRQNGLANQSISISFVDEAGDVLLSGGDGEQSYAQIGHGSVVSTDRNRVGHITISNAKDVRLDGGDEIGSFAQIGNGGTGIGGSKVGDITITASGSLEVNGGDADDSYAQIGNGGGAATGSKTGSISIKAGSVSLQTGDAARAYAQIGNGGHNADFGNNSTTADDYISVISDGDISLSAELVDTDSGADSSQAYAQIGHGGQYTSTNETLEGDITVTSENGAITLEGGRSNQNTVQIGHGGLFNGAAAGGDQSGLITVSAKNDISLTGGGGERSIAQIGHGGHGNIGNTTDGHISVISKDGGISLKTLRIEGDATSSNDSYVQIGNGGRLSDGTRTGDIYVQAETGIDLNAYGEELNEDNDGGTGNRIRSYVQIGHGGVGATGDHAGFVTVVNEGSGVISLTAGDDNYNNRYVQIGHGGNALEASDLSGSISVVNLGGGITLESGDQNSSSGAMIGHGDSRNAGSGGTRTGGLNVYADGVISMTDGDAIGAYISHQTSDGISSVSYAGSGIQADGDSGYSLVATGGITFGDAQLSGQGNSITLGETLGAAIVDGDVTLASGGATSDLDLRGLIDVAALNGYTSSFELSFAAGRDLMLDFSVQNAGDGNVNLMAGWDSDITGAFIAPTMTNTGVVFNSAVLPDFEPVFAAVTDDDEYGENSGVVTLGAVDQATRVSVGSRLGTTTVLGSGLVLQAGNSTDNAATQLGYFFSGADVDGAIDVGLFSDGLILNSGDTVGSFTQIGHGGFTWDAATGTLDGNLNGDITISFSETGEVELNSGVGQNAYAQIGHGITSEDQSGGTPENNVRQAGKKTGDVEITNFSSITMQGGEARDSYAQIGHGGADGDGIKTGDIILTGATESLERGSIVMNGGGNNDSYAQIGHGGQESNDAKTGSIAISKIVNFDMNGGAGIDSHVQVGHGGNDGSNGVVSGHIVMDLSGNLTMDAGLENETYAQIGHGGHTQTNGVMNEGESDITITTGGYVSLAGTAAGSPSSSPDENIAPQAFAQIGHGGRGSRGGDSGSSARERYGDITITANGVDVSGNAISLQGGNSNESYAQIGHGGREADSYYKGDIILIADGNVEVKAGNRSRAYAMIGHGGDESEKVEGVIGADVYGTLNGNEGLISVTTTSGGNLLVQGSQGTLGSGTDILDANAMVGHGGHGTFGDHSGTITIDVEGSVTVEAGVDTDSNSDDRNYAQIGHGGDNADGDHSGDISVTAAESISVTGGTGTFSYAQIGHGGKNAEGDKSGAVTVTATTGSVEVVAGKNDESYAQIGHGGHEADFITGATVADVINITAGTSVSVVGAQIDNSSVASQAYAQIGHGGQYSFGDHNAAINVTANGGSVEVTGGMSNQTTAQIGHGGLFNGNNSDSTFAQGGSSAGDITVIGETDVVVEGGQNLRAYAQIGHGGFDHDGDQTGDVKVTALTGKVEVDSQAPSAAEDAYAQIGHGGTNLNGNLSGDITVSGNTEVNVLGTQNQGSRAYAQIGHGGDSSQKAGNTIGGAIDVTAVTGSVLMQGNSQFSGQAYVQIGHGGNNNGATVGGAAINVSATGTGGTITVKGSGAQNHVQIGHGGEKSSGSLSGDILVEADQDITLTGGTNTDAMTQIGHGGADSTGASLAGRIQVQSANGAVVLAGAGGNEGAAVQIGHGGVHSSVRTTNITGDIAVDAGTDVFLNASSGGASESYAQIGHGGLNLQGGKSGKVTVFAGQSASGSISLIAGNDSSEYAQIGHGGVNAGGDLSGGIYVSVENDGDIILKGGSEENSYAIVGHGGVDADSNISGDILVESTGGSLDLDAGTGDLTFAQVGHGGHSTDGTFLGDLLIEVGSGISITGGSGDEAYAQIGLGGARSSGYISGDINVVSGESISISSLDGDLGAYSKIGHGDDLFSTANTIDTLSGSGNRIGDINVSAVSDIVLSNGMIGHVNHASQLSGAGASALGGITQIAVSAAAPTDPTGGSLIADSESEFSGADELRFYLPERSNNQIAVDALLNGESFVGAEVDPSATQRDDEFTVDITGVIPSSPNEHDNAFGTGPSPTNAAGFAFYYNSIELTDPPVEVSTEGGGTSGGSFLFTLADFLNLRPEDKTEGDWLRENERRITGFNSFEMYYEGYEQYDVNGRSVYHLIFTNHVDSRLEVEVDFEDILSLQDRFSE
ncbi:MAG: hypothetical protein P1U68_12940 [Verrucomicrobiales bacterium]|nr:hypothetical protein [Verrucomicrobiales bacterium]